MTTYINRPNRLARVDVYTDGACSGAPGPGGWAWAVLNGRSDSGGEKSTTNQRMEMTAAYKAVSAFDSLTPITIVTDSAYVMNCFEDKWYEGWMRRDWHTARGAKVANQDIWKLLIPAVLGSDVQFRKVAGHSGDPGNDLVDHLAVEAKRRFM